MEKSILKYFLFFLIWNSLVFAQIPIGSFYRFNEYNSGKECSGIYFYDYDKDGIEDIFLTGNLSRKISMHRIGQRQIIENVSSKYFPFVINGIDKFYQKGDPKEKHIFISTLSKTAGLLSINPHGYPEIFTHIKLDSKPDKVISDKSGYLTSRRAIVIGKNFNGITLLYSSENRIKQKKIAQYKVFSSAEFTDLNSDDFSDIIAFNKMRSSFEVYYSDQNIEYSLRRTIPVYTDVKTFKMFDINRDGFNDLIYSEEKKLHIMYGDSVSSFAEQGEIFLGSDANEFTIADLNSDNLYDIMFLSGTKTSIVFAKSEKSYWNEIVYDNDSDRKAAVLHMKKNNPALFIYYSTGKIATISKFRRKQSFFSIKFNSSAHKAELFKHQKSNSIALLDSVNRKLIVLSDFQTDSSKLYSCYLSQSYNNITSYGNYLIVYSKNNKWVDIVKFEKGKNPFKVKTLFINNPLIDIGIGKKEKLMFLSGNKKQLETSSFELNNFKLTKEISIPVDNSLNIFYGKSSEDVISLVTDSTKIYLTFLKTGELHELNLKEEPSKPILFGYDFVNKKEGFSVFCRNSHNIILASAGKQLKNKINTSILDYDVFNTALYDLKGRKKLFIYNKINTKMYEVRIMENRIHFLPRFTFPLKRMSFCNFSNSERFFILTNSKNNSISFSRIL